jgi:outer membrane immunogenic protein
MNRIFGAAALVLATWPALAADVPRAPAPPVRPAVTIGYDWSGAYGGVNLGYVWGTIENLAATQRGIAGGAQAGYNWQVGQIVFGSEADVQASGAEDTFAAYKFSNPWFGTVRGRIGYAFNNIPYATTGLAFGGGKLQFAGLTESNVHTGWVGGGGIEVGLTPPWSAKAEYLFTSLGDRTYVLSGVSSGIDSHTVRTGPNYPF